MKSEAEPEFASRIEAELKDLNAQWDHICQQVPNLLLWLVLFKLIIRSFHWQNLSLYTYANETEFRSINSNNILQSVI